MKHGSQWYKRVPVDFLGGVQGMTDRQHAVYSVVLDLIYQYGGECHNDPKFIAGFFSNVGVVAVRATLLELIELGKISLTDAGKLTQKRALNEVKTRENLRENLTEHGRKGAEKRWNSYSDANENNELDLASAKNGKMPDKIREDKSKNEPSVPKKTGTRIPEDFEPEREWAVAQGLSIAVLKVELEKFKNYWSAKSGKDATKLDWEKTWRNWILTAKERLGVTPASRAPRNVGELIDQRMRAENEQSNFNGKDRLLLEGDNAGHKHEPTLLEILASTAKSRP